MVTMKTFIRNINRNYDVGSGSDDDGDDVDVTADVTAAKLTYGYSARQHLSS